MDAKYKEHIERAYNTISPLLGVFSLEDTLLVFDMYFTEYERHMSRQHPFLKTEQLADIIERLHYCEGTYRAFPSYRADYLPADYETIIRAHFRTKYAAGCDYNINHFMSGVIRFMRCF